jgi:tRNA-dihydrouridine synthase B
MTDCRDAQFDYNVGVIESDQIVGTAGGLAVGDVGLPGRALLAPMSGVTDVAMRRIAERFGAALTLTEMVASDDYVAGTAEARMRAEMSGLGHHAVQLAGCDPHWMGEAARLAEASGAALIDINMGCPVKRVTGGYAGSALMRDVDRALRLIEATVRSVRVPVTLKMRLGWDDAGRNAPELARRAEAAGIRLVTVHGRTRQQFYKGCADWQAIGEVKRSLAAIPLVANGDCHSVEDARAMLDLSGADAVMIGRAAIGQPWIVGDADFFIRFGRRRRTASGADRLAAVLEHYDRLLAMFGAQKGLRHARKHLAAYGRNAGASGGQVARLATSDDPESVRAALSEIFCSSGVAGIRGESRVHWSSEANSAIPPQTTLFSARAGARAA